MYVWVTNKCTETCVYVFILYHILGHVRGCVCLWTHMHFLFANTSIAGTRTENLLLTDILSHNKPNFKTPKCNFFFFPAHESAHPVIHCHGLFPTGSGTPEARRHHSVIFPRWTDIVVTHSSISKAHLLSVEHVFFHLNHNHLIWFLWCGVYCRGMNRGRQGRGSGIEKMRAVDSMGSWPRQAEAR